MVVDKPWTSPAGLIPVLFLQSVAPYNAGEVAGFPLEVAKSYVKRELAEYYKPDAAERPAAVRSVVTRIPVRFLKSSPPYNAGEVAGFVAKVAEDYIARGIAEQAGDPVTLGAPAVERPAVPDDSASLRERVLLLESSHQALIDAHEQLQAAHLDLQARHEQAQLGQGEGSPVLTLEPGPDFGTQTLTIDQVAELMDEVKDPGRIHALTLGEQLHPDYPGGRKGALELLALRAAELAPPAG